MIIVSRATLLNRGRENEKNNNSTCNNSKYSVGV